MTGKRGITVLGAGRDKTFLRFANSNDQDGLSINRVTGITNDATSVPTVQGPIVYFSVQTAYSQLDQTTASRYYTN